jgi:tetratricopeptide (TPR) repeat protein
MNMEVLKERFRTGALVAGFCLTLSVAGAVQSDAKSPPDWNKLLSKGNAEYNVSRFREAAAEYTKVLAKYPDSAPAHLALARADKKMNQADEAKTELRRAIELDPELAEAYYELGTLQESDKQFMPAAQSFEKFLSLKPESAERRNIEDRIRNCKQSSQ